MITVRRVVRKAEGQGKRQVPDVRLDSGFTTERQVLVCKTM